MAIASNPSFFFALLDNSVLLDHITPLVFCFSTRSVLLDEPMRILRSYEVLMRGAGSTLVFPDVDEDEDEDEENCFS